MIFHEQPSAPWSDWDFSLLEAYQILQDETCPKCGQPSWLCRTTDPRVRFTVHESTCYAEKALMEKADSEKPSKEKAKKGQKAEWGRSRFARAEVNPARGDSLPTRKEAYEANS